MDARYAKIAPRVATVVTLFTFGCGSHPNTIREIDTEEDGSSTRAVRRECSFEINGYACKDPASPVASKQAAIIQAFCKALIEARRCRGESTSDFTIQVGEHLTVTHRGTPEDHELQLVLKCEGQRTRFVVANGVLRSRVQDFDMLQQIFDETGGEFALLALEDSEEKDGFVARVGCYMQQAAPVMIAGDITAEGDDIAP